MKTLKLISCLGLALIVCVHGKRQQPSHDEIERIINETHSVIWKCPECHPGSGLIAQCGTSISIDIPIKCVPCVKGVNYSNTQDHSTCKSCRNCAKHENKRGECSAEEDTTECLGTCHKGLYMDKITGECHPCSDCCNIVTTKSHHEEQCEDSGLPRNQQCRQSNYECPHSTMTSPPPENPDDEPGSQGTSTIALIIIGIFLLLLIVLVLFLWRCYGWERVKSFLTKCCCCCCSLVLPTGGNTVHFHASDHFIEHDLEAAHGTVSGSHLTESGDVLSSLPAGAKTVRRPTFHRLHSVPVETKSKSKIVRAFSHPGALKDLSKFEKLKETFKRPGGKKHTKEGYTLVETKPSMIDNLSAERVDRKSFPTPTTSGELAKFFLGADDFEAREPSNETPAPPNQHEIDMPVENHDKICDIKPALSGSVPGNGLLQSAGSRVGDPHKEGLGKSSVTDQCTSTTELHLSSMIKFANIPQDFLDWCLTKRMLTIPTEFCRKICMMIDIPRELFWDDYRLLAEKIGLGPDVILWLEQQRNKTKLILQQFDAQEDPSIRRFKEILEVMGRNDVVTVIEDWLLFEWNKQTANPLVL